MFIFSIYFFFFNDTATTEIYTLSLHDALPIFRAALNERLPLVDAGLLSTTRHPMTQNGEHVAYGGFRMLVRTEDGEWRDRKSTRLNSSHSQISYAVFCLKKKNNELSIAIRTTN